jgi:hypothetical protein
MGHASYGNNSQQDPQIGEKPDPKAASRKPEGGQAAQDLPAAGPHAEPELTNDKATPGAGTLPEPGDPDGTDATSG